MQIYIENGYSKPMSVAMALYNTSCNGSWETLGWWNIDPNGLAYVANTCNQYFFFYAEATDGAQWAGPYDFEVAEGAFDFCPPPGVGVEGATVGMRMIDASNAFGGIFGGLGGICWPWTNYTLTLHGKSPRGK